MEAKWQPALRGHLGDGRKALESSPGFHSQLGAAAFKGGLRIQRELRGRQVPCPQCSEPQDQSLGGPKPLRHCSDEPQQAPAAIGLGPAPLGTSANFKFEEGAR